MGRYSTGALITKEVCRIELSYLLKRKFIQKGRTIFFTLSWSNGNNISVTSNYFPNDIWLRLVYTLTDTNRETFDYDYKIYLTERPSNLGIESVLYFICPNSGNLCRILYKCYGSHIWKSRNAHKNRIYYSSQITSKLDYFNDRYWQLDNLIKKLRSQRKSYYYRNNKTKRLQRIERLAQQQVRFDNLRWTVGLPKRLKQHYNEFWR